LSSSLKEKRLKTFLNRQQYSREERCDLGLMYAPLLLTATNKSSFLKKLLKYFTLSQEGEWERQVGQEREAVSMTFFFQYWGLNSRPTP
jgi:hypothetical protein